MDEQKKSEVVIEEKNGNTEKKVEIEVIPGKSEHEHHEYKKDGKNCGPGHIKSNRFGLFSCKNVVKTVACAISFTILFALGSKRVTS